VQLVVPLGLVRAAGERVRQDAAQVDVSQVLEARAAGEDRWAVVSPSAAFALAVSVAVTLLLGLWPAPVVRAAREAARSLLP
jgi:hypothetical protein